MRLRRLFRVIHKWVGLILGIQILLWFASGFLMSFMPINEVRGNHLLKNQEPKPIYYENIDLDQIVKQVDTPVISIQIIDWLGTTAVNVKSLNKTQRFSTPDMQLMKPLDETAIRRILNEQLIDITQINSIKLLTEIPDEARGQKAPLWVAELGGGENANIYVSEETGEIVAKRTNRWRLFDFMWMLHIMDYDERADFNHPLLYLTALSALIFTLTGFVLLYFSLRKPTKRPIQPL